MVSISGRFVDRCVLVLEGDAGWGARLARAFRAEGAKLAITGTCEDALRALAEELDALAIRADVADGQACAGIIDEVGEALGGIDLLVTVHRMSAAVAIEQALPLMRAGGVILLGDAASDLGPLGADLAARRIALVPIPPALRLDQADSAEGVLHLAKSHAERIMQGR